METPKLLTDDMDIRDTELSMYHGNNGDYYICLKETKRGEVIKLDTRIAMSGGNATPAIQQAVSNLFKALLGQQPSDEMGDCNMPHVTHRCNLKRYGDVEMKCVKCGYVTWRDDSKTTQELIEQMVREGYPLPDCSNGG